MTVTRFRLLIFLAALAYGLGHFAWYAETPLGRVPVLDEQENLALTEQIVNGTLPREPFYRAMGYPVLLAVLRWTGVAEAQLPLAALLLGTMLHAVCAVLAGGLARRWFDDPRAGWWTGLLVALNPVLVHYSSQRLDATLGLLFFLAGLASLALEEERAGPRAWLGASVFWALAALTRPQYLTVWLALPVLCIWRYRRMSGQALGCVAVGGVLFLGQGLWQSRVSGEFRILPWQGAYNLWAANEPGAHGRYYQQTVNLAYGNAGENPARIESRVRFQRETGSSTAGIDAMNAHWRKRFADQVLHHPAAWTALLLRKTYALLNDWEQYNNKTYSLHKKLSPWLRFNPLGWGLLLVLGVAGIWRMKNIPCREGSLLISAACAAGIVLFYVSARFRLPLAVITSIWAGGALARPFFWETFPSARRWIFASSLLAAALVTFSSLDGVRDERPVVQDHLLMARAAQVVGDDATVWQEAEAALTLDPTRSEADEFVVIAGFNRQLRTALSASDLARWRASARRLLAARTGGLPARVIAAFVESDLPLLHAFTQDNGSNSPEALGALALLHAADSTEMQRLESASMDAGATFFLMAKELLHPDDFARWAQTHEPAGWVEALVHARQRLLSP